MDRAEAVRRFVCYRVRAQARHKGRLLAEPTDAMNLVDSGLFDSLGFVGLITAVEEEFGVEVDFGDVDPETFTTLGGIVQCTLSAGAASAHPPLIAGPAPNHA